MFAELTISDSSRICSTNKGRATRDRVLDAAAALVFERGVAGTTLDDLRAAANVSKGQLYHYFADKDDLVHAVIERTIQQVLDAQPRLLDLSTWTAIAAWFDDLVQLQVDRHAIGRVISWRVSDA